MNRDRRPDGPPRLDVVALTQTAGSGQYLRAKRPQP